MGKDIYLTRKTIHINKQEYLSRQNKCEKEPTEENLKAVFNLFEEWITHTVINLWEVGEEVNDFMLGECYNAMVEKCLWKFDLPYAKERLRAILTHRISTRFEAKRTQTENFCKNYATTPSENDCMQGLSDSEVMMLFDTEIGDMARKSLVERYYSIGMDFAERSIGEYKDKYELEELQSECLLYITERIMGHKGNIVDRKKFNTLLFAQLHNIAGNKRRERNKAYLKEIPIHRLKNDLLIEYNFDSRECQIEEHRLLEEELKNLRERELKILRFRMGYINGHPMTLEQTGVRMGSRRERVRQIEARALRKLRGRFHFINTVKHIVHRNEPYIYLKTAKIFNQFKLIDS